MPGEHCWGEDVGWGGNPVFRAINPLKVLPLISWYFPPFQGGSGFPPHVLVANTNPSRWPPKRPLASVLYPPRQPSVPPALWLSVGSLC